MSSKRSPIRPIEYMHARPVDAQIGKRTQSRRRFLQTAAGAAGVLLLPDVWNSAFASGSGTPNPIPHVTPGPFGPLHFFFPGPVEGVNPNTGHDPSVITDFNGFIGNADLLLTGTGTDTTTNVSGPYHFHTDMRFI